MRSEQTSIALPRFYPIIDAELLKKRGVELNDFARQLSDAGVRLVQYRAKHASADEIAESALALRSIFSHDDCLLILNDYAELTAGSGWSGVHLGQKDASADLARRSLGMGSIIGVSTHNEQQVTAEDAGCANYIAVGPVFGTSTKADAEPVIGLEGVRRLRSLTRKPLVAIGGITRANCRAVIQAGADSVAVISELLAPSAHPLQKVAEDFLLHLR